VNNRYRLLGETVEDKEKQEFIDLIEQNQGLIHKVCRCYCNSSEDRRDLFQEILLQLWRSFDSFRREAGISTWIYRVALNTAISGLRHRKRNPPEESLGELDAIGNAASGNDWMEEEPLRRLHEAISALSGVDKALLMLHLDEKSYDEIGSLFGMSSNRVGVKLHRIKAKLKERLSTHE
jgi:RNA polymerase sigma-70 factor (ECF subfamily)